MLQPILMKPALLDMLHAMPRVIGVRYVFLNAGKSYSKTTIWKIIAGALDDAGFEEVHPYAAGHHSFATIRSAKGQPSLDLQYEMGHADIRTT